MRAHGAIPAVDARLVIAFSDEPRALAFERYLKSGSGAAFTERYLR